MVLKKAIIFHVGNTKRVQLSLFSEKNRLIAYDAHISS